MSLTRTSQNGTALTKDTTFFDKKQAIICIEPTSDTRTLYFLECNELVFQKDGDILDRKQGSGEGVLPKDIGVVISYGRAKAV